MKFILHPWQLFFLILSGWVIRRNQGEIQCKERLGGMLRYYYRDAA